ncbi:MAG: hypothetical protein PWQ20_367 [Thermotogaceae bacterium]|jgi:GntR family transcriptional regulator|nr:hypothetical protein [Thermotogaceae bacterium]MDN5337297.1 hypothetical protein [Thermotogaceae bacterium]
MWFKIDIRSPLSLNEQIKMGIKESILKGVLKEGDILPSIRELASSLKVNPNTVVRAYKALESEGIIIAKQGIGYLVLKGKSEIRELILKDFARKISGEAIRLKKIGFNVDEVMEVIKEIWKKK